ncbi:GNAT family N-acetyltransferase [Conyzicola nivalis]|nr:GNAT family N-acetyltransferase [Conyzicola nivalis]
MAEHELHLRRYVPTDAAATLRCFQRAVRGTASRDYDPEQIESWAPGDVDLDAWGRRRASAETWVAERDGEPVGFTDVDDDGYIDMMFVDPDAARTGVASALLQRIVDLANARGCAELSTNASITARPFFERHGFQIVAEQRVERRGSVLTNYRMRRPLTG